VKDVRVQITPEIIQEVKGRLIQRSLQAKSHYEAMSDLELLKKFEFQTWNHYFGVCIGSSDDVELYVTKGILLERGYKGLMKKITKICTDESKRPIGLG
jgi:hypothetical protein